VESPGIYQLNSDEMSLVAALMKSGGILEDGAGVINIRHADTLDVNLLPVDDFGDPNGVLKSEEEAVKTAKQKTLVLPVKDLNIPFADVRLYDGDIVEVAKLNPAVFTVLGVVNNPGAFPYPPDVEYSIASALAFAGGPDLSLGPRYLTIYRQDADGEVVSASFGIDGKSMARAASIMIKPGDVISVDETFVTRARMIMKEMLDIRLAYDISDSFD
jgi:protein involved in polysaccharide export with SLBB domain